MTMQGQLRGEIPEASSYSWGALEWIGMFEGLAVLLDMKYQFRGLYTELV